MWAEYMWRSIGTGGSVKGSSNSFRTRNVFFPHWQWCLVSSGTFREKNTRAAVSFQKITKWATQVAIKHRSDSICLGYEQVNKTSHQLYWKVFHYSPVPYFSVYNLLATR